MATGWTTRAVEHSDATGHELVTFVKNTWSVQYEIAPARGDSKPRPVAITVRCDEGVNVSDVRALPLGELLANARRGAGTRAARLTRPSDVDLQAFRSDRRGLEARTDRDFAELAFHYVMHVSEGDRHPAKTLADQLGTTPATMVNRIREARKRGLLTPTTPGRSGGELTDRACELLGIREED